MASLQRYQSHGRHYYRIVESFRLNGRPRLRVLAHLGRVEEILGRYQDAPRALRVSSVSAGAVTALYHLAQELALVSKIDRALEQATGRIQKRRGLSVGETLLAGIVGRACAPRSKRAFAAWAETTHLPELMGFEAARLTSEHFWEQMHAVPVEILGAIEQELVREVLRVEQLRVEALAYDTTNFYTHIASSNRKPQLPERGHNKQRRHDLRQLGLALVVDQHSQLPLAHELYEGSRSDMRSFAAFLRPVRKRLRELTAEPQQLTLVFDAGASSKQNLESLDPRQDHYVTAVRPSDQRALLAAAAERLAEVVLPNGEVVRAWRGRRLIAGQQRETVVVFSPALYEGQLRGLEQQLARCGRELERLGLPLPRGTRATIERRLARICGRQYVRKLLRYEVGENQDGATEVRMWCDREEYRRLTTQYFGLRVLISDREEWETGRIIAAYRGLSRAEGAFRDLKDPGMLSTRPQFHWTDQKLRVHAFMCVTGYLLVRLLWWRARREVGWESSPRSLLAELAGIRSCRLVEHSGKAGRPRVRQQLEEMPPERARLGARLRAFPPLK